MSLNVNTLDQVVYVITNEDNVVYVTNVPNNIGQPSIQFQDEGINLGTAGTVNQIDFVGSGIQAQRTGSKITVTASGGGSSGLTSFNGRTDSNVVPQQSDYDSFFLTPSEGNSLYQPLGDYCITLISDCVPSSTTGTVSEVQVASVFVPANTIRANDILEFYTFFTKVGTNANFTIRVNVNTSNSLTGDTTIAAAGTGAGIANTSLSVAMIRRLHIESLTSQRVHTTAVGVLNDIVQSSTAHDNLTTNYGVDQYFTVSIQAAGTSDTITLRGWYLKIIRS